MRNLKGFKFRIDDENKANLVHEATFQDTLEDSEIIGRGSHGNKRYARREATQEIDINGNTGWSISFILQFCFSFSILPLQMQHGSN